MWTQKPPLYSGPITSQLPEEQGRGRHICHVNEPNLHLTGWETTAMVKFMKGRNSGVCYHHLQAGGGGFHVNSYRTSQFSTWAYCEKQLWVSSGHSSLDFTQKLKNWKESGVVKGNKHSPLYLVSCLSSHIGYHLLPYLPLLNPRLAVKAAGTKLIWLWRWSPGTEQMQPKDKV